MSKTIICLMGPTACGKTQLACELISHFPMEIISVDSAMIYREMNIGTAKPSIKELRAAPHHLIDIVDPIDSYSVAQFCHDTLRLCEAIIERGSIPLLVGGTMMYFNALQQGLASLPEADKTIRQQLETEIRLYGLDFLYQQLLRVDPITAAKIHPHDSQRIQRAVEIYQITKKPLSLLLEEQQRSSPYHFVNIALFPQQRLWLHRRIEQRFDLMLKAGFIDEVHSLRAKWKLELTHPAMRCVGYRQALHYLQGDIDEASFREKGIAATRQLAKRQLTWLRSWNNIACYDPQMESFGEEIIAKLREILDNKAS